MSTEEHYASAGLTIIERDGSTLEAVVATGGVPRVHSDFYQSEGDDMTTVLVSGWNIGFHKVGFTKLLQRELAHSLLVAKKLTDAVMDDQQVELQVEEDRAESLVVRLTEIGARCAVAVPTR